MLKFLLKYKQTLLLALSFILLITTLDNLFRQNKSLNTNQINKLISDTKLNKQIPIIATTTTQLRQTYNLNKIYPHLLACTKTYAQPWSPAQKLSPISGLEAYSRPASNETHSMRLTRAVLVYFPIQSVAHFAPEFKWLYRSWIEMQKYEPKMWRTDLIIFLERDEKLFADEKFFLNKLNCSFSNLRSNENDKPMCTLIEFVSVQKRNLTEPLENTQSFGENGTAFDSILENVDIFTDGSHLDPFYWLMKTNLAHYGYLNSILMAFEGYEYFKTAKYDFLIRSDMDVFLTPLFGHWTPRHCNDFVVGGGGYSADFNTKRLKRIANSIGLKSAGIWNLGSTWYSTPAQFRLVSYYTLFGMAYLSSEEFSKPEREGKLGVELWPEWHYGVLLLYGQSLGLNHLIETNQLNVVRLEHLIDYHSGYTESIHKIIHIHVFHGGDMFSKFVFKEGKYDNMSVTDEQAKNVKFYALKMALEGKRLGEEKLIADLQAQASTKT